MTKMIIWARGDRSVGIPSRQTTIDLGIDLDGDERAYWTLRVKELFAEMWDDGSTQAKCVEDCKNVAQAD